jgi:hypothetical protein
MFESWDEVLEFAGFNGLGALPEAREGAECYRILIAWQPWGAPIETKWDDDGYRRPHEYGTYREAREAIGWTFGHDNGCRIPRECLGAKIVSSCDVIDTKGETA